MINTGGFGGTNSAHSENLSSEPMDIENTEGQKPVFKPNRTAQRQKNIKNNAGFFCHKHGCRPWKHTNLERVNAHNVSSDHEKQKSESEN